MKKLTVFLLIFCLVFVLAACNTASDNKEGSSDKKTSSTTSAGESHKDESSKDTVSEEAPEDTSPKVGDKLEQPEAFVDINECEAFYVDYDQTTYGVDYSFRLATELDGNTRTVYMSDKGAGDEYVYLYDGNTLSCYYRETADEDFRETYSGKPDTEAGIPVAESYNKILTELEHFLSPASEGYLFIKMQDTSTRFGPCFVYNQITDKTADGYVLIDKDAGIMVSSESHKEGDHKMQVLDFSFEKGNIPAFK